MSEQMPEDARRVIHAIRAALLTKEIIDAIEGLTIEPGASPGLSLAASGKRLSLFIYDDDMAAKYRLQFVPKEAE